MSHEVHGTPCMGPSHGVGIEKNTTTTTNSEVVTSGGLSVVGEVGDSFSNLVPRGLDKVVDVQVVLGGVLRKEATKFFVVENSVL